mmetsp:Transcript_34909/g.88166  ORF Transcript_34909/g.88166 Transcript_34909/m.88166 type:complete len:92 (-) Transcript_34909:317-592(-)
MQLQCVHFLASHCSFGATQLVGVITTVIPSIVKFIARPETPRLLKLPKQVVRFLAPLLRSNVPVRQLVHLRLLGPKHALPQSHGRGRRIRR